MRYTIKELLKVGFIGLLVGFAWAIFMNLPLHPPIQRALFNWAVPAVPICGWIAYVTLLRLLLRTTFQILAGKEWREHLQRKGWSQEP